MKFKTSLQIAFLASVLLLTACNRKAASENVARINQHKVQARMYNNHPFDRFPKRGDSITILSLFELYEEVVDSLSIKISPTSQLEISYRAHAAEAEPHTSRFAGRISKRGYLEVFLLNERKQFPPFVPFIYNKKNYNRFRLTFNEEGDLVIKNKWMQASSIMFFLGGSRSQGKTGYFHPKRKL